MDHSPAAADAALSDWAASRTRGLLLYASVGLVAGAVIALQICIMRVFSVGSWAHFGSLVVSLAMLGFGLTSAIMCVAKGWFERHWKPIAGAALLAFGPLIVITHLAAQQLPFNAIFLVSDPAQKWRLFDNFALYLLPFICGSMFLGCVFLRAQQVFARVYFADLAGSGLCGMLFLVAMLFVTPENLIVVPLLLWALGSIAWFASLGQSRGGIAVVVLAVLGIGAHLKLPELWGIPKLAVSDYKGVSYARKFPDSQRVFERASPFGYLEVYSSSYLHFAPGLSDNAALNLKEIPPNSYLGMYIDGDGPIGILRDLPEEHTAYFKYLPMIYPYLVKKDPETFVVQFGGGISTRVALRNSAKVTVAEGNPAILDAFLNEKVLKDFTGDILHHPKLSVIDYDGRLYLAHTDRKYDVIDLSLADSTGLSSPGGFAIVEKYAYSREAMRHYMQALKPGGVLAVTLWNKEEPPKSVLKLYATMVAAAREAGEPDVSRSFFAVSSYLSSTTVLFQRGGFADDTVAMLRKHTDAMSWDEIYSPGMAYDDSHTDATLSGFTESIFGNGDTASPAGAPANSDGSAPVEDGSAPVEDGSAPAVDGSAPTDAPPPLSGSTVPSTTLGRIAWHHLIAGDWDPLAARYVFDTRALSNNAPYFAAYVRPSDLPRVTDRLELLQDEWGYLLLWATLAIACLAGVVLISIPLAFGWRTIFSRYPSKARTILYFACLGLGYIMVEVGLIAHFILALSNATVSASVLITGMLMFSGLGSLVSEKYLARARGVMPWVFVAIGLLLIGYGLWIDRVLDLIGALPYGWRLLCCFGLIAPPAFLMGFPMPTGMTTLARLGKDHMFLWAWGVNGCFSVIGAAVVPLVATSFGLSAVMIVAGSAYLVALPAFFGVLRPLRSGDAVAAG